MISLINRKGSPIEAYHRERARLRPNLEKLEERTLLTGSIYLQGVQPTDLSLMADTNGNLQEDTVGALYLWAFWSELAEPAAYHPNRFSKRFLHPVCTDVIQ